MSKTEKRAAAAFWKELRALTRAQKATDGQLKKTDEQLKKTSEELRKAIQEGRKTREEVASLTGAWGDFAEGMAGPAVAKEFGQRGFTIVSVGPPAKRVIDGQTLEVDLLGVGRRNGTNVVIVGEVKARLRLDAVAQLRKNLRRFDDFFFEYAGYERIGVVCGARIDRGMETYAAREGFYVMEPSGDSFKIIAEPAPPE